ncbi:SprT-like domain-containing protein [Sporomusa sphaeroides]|uniref:SprT-like family protein n=1 Tax=Sporomusa sphaeroides DSM 2875 TaxID=1337886 RepID=A0A1U7MA92_9FIRM|nr:SprT-like domain-containing protein [Sporomusa sphaeroides]OLS54356.1 SprT-like family protein [Sporomusa sphaeroides DSM 2875]CVK21652.1 SprT-like family protein [Sporomusa sphaeroides DSM 2875]
MYSTIQKKEPTHEQYTKYQELYNYFNQQLFNSKLPCIILNFSRKANVAGFFAPNRWISLQGKNKTHEISINPTYIASVEFIEVCQTLVHEQAHLWQMVFGKPSRSGYHNKEWANKMENIGLMPSSTGQEGGKKVGQKMSDYVIKGGKFEKAFVDLPKDLTLPWISNEFDSVVSNDEDGSDPKPPKIKSKIKYSCPGCTLNVWGKPNIKVYCKSCESYLEPIE